MLANEDGTSAMIENCLKLYKNGIKKTNQTLSLTLLFMVTFTLIGLVSSVYTSITFAFFSGNNFGYANTIIAVGYVIFSATNLWTVCYLNALSQKVSDQVTELREKLTDCSNLEQSVEQSKSKAIQLLNLFHGFDCCGFVTLGRPLLSSIITTVVTYTII